MVGDAHSLLVVGGSPGRDLSKDPCCDRRSSSRLGWGRGGVARVGRVVRSGGLMSLRF